ncbi:unnamed protein product [Didymodactylos carnosus]|uniref:Uncharacterized protein n=1 Tax=Didymodactylos carnosus TaxID=1234261 RepID=A0A814M846_9BILA|nr:unnamed protein product [Didymodactylos carnosus]CAF1075822.1 unnamed protein product [Didymodactylos carnosus]CAF3751178.1 unnamed protein product [Didymodactylos carnosus]CAF3842376.1 unnamed protein product [Didymodactylos carnosus]
MASSSSYGSRYSRRSSLSTVANIQANQSLNRQQSKKNLTDSPIADVKDERVSRRRSSPSARHLKTLQMQTTAATPQRSRNNDDGDIIGMYDENDNQDDQVEQLNISSASIATESMEMSQQSSYNNYSTSVNGNNMGNKSTITKYELLNRYFKKLNTGGYYCNLCNGTKHAQKVRFFKYCAEVITKQFLLEKTI